MEIREREKGMTGASNERLSLASTDTDAIQATFSGFSFPLDEGDRGGGNEKREGERNRTKERTTECEGRVMFSPGHVAIFPFGKGRARDDCCNVTSLALTRL